MQGLKAYTAQYAECRLLDRNAQTSTPPRGGYYAEVYRSADVIALEGLPHRFMGERPASTSIYYLLEGEQVSHLHRIKSDEIQHFYAGAALTIFTLDDEGHADELKLGNRPEKGEAFQRVVKAGDWFGAAVSAPSSYALVGCTVAPGFHFDDFELVNRTSMLRTYPQHENLIRKLTR